MNEWLWAAAAGLLALNGYAALLMRHDKRQAGKGGRRVPEKRLLLLAAIGGSAGIAAGMRWWRHKTRHAAFRYGVPLVMAAQALLLVYTILRGTGRL